MNLREVANDFAKFVDALVFNPGGGERSFGHSLADFQRQRFALIAPAIQALAKGETPPVGRLWLEATKGASKDTDLSAAILWLTAFARREIVGQVGARDAGQSGEMLRAARSFLRLNPWLARFVEAQASSLINHRTGSRIDFVSADSQGAHGSRPLLSVLNELTHADRAFCETMADNAGKVADGLLIVATNAGTIGSWQAGWREIAETSDRWRMHVLAEPAPWISEAEIREAEKRSSRERVDRLWRGQWTGSSGGAFSEDALSRALTVDGPADRSLRGWTYFAGVDLGLRKDAAAIVVIGRHDGCYEEAPPAPKPVRSRLSRLLIDLDLIESPIDEEIFPEFDSDRVAEGSGRIRLIATVKSLPAGARGIDVDAFERKLYDLHRIFQCQRIAYDPWELRLRAQTWAQRGLPVIETPATGPNLSAMTQSVLEVFNEKIVDLYADPDLLQDLRAAKVEQRSFGERIVSPRDATGHGDVLSAFMLALLAARRGHIGAIDAPLVAWPA